MDAARNYANARGAAGVSPMSPIPSYAHEMPGGDGSGMTPGYRQHSYPYSASGRAYYPSPSMSGWASAAGYHDDGAVDYGLQYPSYPIIHQEPANAAPLVSGYGTTTTGSPYNTRRPVYVDSAEAAATASPSYNTYGGLVHRPAAGGAGSAGDAQGGFSLSSMAASLPSASDRLQSGVNKTLPSPSSLGYHRADGSAGSIQPYQNGKPMAVQYSSLQSAYETPYSATTTDIAHRATAHADAAYPPASNAAVDHLYAGTAGEHGIRPEDPHTGIAYVYGGGGGDTTTNTTNTNTSHSNGSGSGSGSSHTNDHDNGRSSRHSTRLSNSGSASTGTGTLSNGHVYVPQQTTYVMPPSAPQAHGLPHMPLPTRSIDSSSSSAGSGATSLVASVDSISSLNSHSRQQREHSRGNEHEQQHRRSAGSLRGG
ncbi:hypothetical protein F4808DRAFT_475485 [Astrocystis sublimbata]|nr:hypothetical protein F4808DRAFT_475485 [Astrocystis sublimbata]